MNFRYIIPAIILLVMGIILSYQTVTKANAATTSIPIVTKFYTDRNYSTREFYMIQVGDAVLVASSLGGIVKCN